MPLLTNLCVLAVVFGVQDDDVSLLQKKKQRQSRRAIHLPDLHWFQIRANFGAKGYCLTAPPGAIPNNWQMGHVRPLIFEPCGYDNNGQPNNKHQRWTQIHNTSDGALTHLVAHWHPYIEDNARQNPGWPAQIPGNAWSGEYCIDIQSAHCNDGQSFVLWPCDTDAWNAQFGMDWIDQSNYSKQKKFYSADKLHLNNGTRGCDKCLDMVDATSGTDWVATENKEKRAVLWSCKDAPETLNQAFEKKEYCFQANYSYADLFDSAGVQIRDPHMTLGIGTHVEGSCTTTTTTTTTTTATTTMLR